jgi:hypothetical protein
MTRLLTFPCHSILSVDNQLTGSIPSELGELTSLRSLSFRTWISLSCSYEYHACSHVLAIIFEQIQMNSRVPFRANSENLPCWLICISVRAFVWIFLINVTLAHISLPFYYSIRWKRFDWRPRSDLLWRFICVVCFSFWLQFWSCLQLLHCLLLMPTRGPSVSATRIIVYKTSILYITNSIWLFHFLVIIAM